MHTTGLGSTHPEILSARRMRAVGRLVASGELRNRHNGNTGRLVKKLSDHTRLHAQHFPVCPYTQELRPHKA